MLSFSVCKPSHSTFELRMHGYRTLCSKGHRTMDTVQNKNHICCFTLSSEGYRLSVDLFSSRACSTVAACLSVWGPNLYLHLTVTKHRTKTMANGTATGRLVKGRIQHPIFDSLIMMLRYGETEHWGSPRQLWQTHHSRPLKTRLSKTKKTTTKSLISNAPLLEGM